MRPPASVLFLVLLVSPLLPAQITVDSTMDWSTGLFRLSASMPLGEGTAPDDHPRAIEDLERDLKPLVVEELGNLTWDNRGTLSDLMKRDPVYRTAVENLAATLVREWSRLSDDYRFIEAAYITNLSQQIPQIFPPGPLAGSLPTPIGWRPVPEDDWTGIVIYIPDGLPIRGTGLSADAFPALRARILTDDLNVLSDPGTGSGKTPLYMSLENRSAAEEIVGRRPYRAMARGLYGDSPCDIILSTKDAGDILASPASRAALEEGRIVLLLSGNPD